jgi:hypothetical protein
MDRGPMLNRATELAASGDYRGCSEVIRQLESEGYTKAREIFSELTIWVRIDEACEDAFHAQRP